MYQLLKRILDITIAIVLLLALIPFLLPIVIALRLTAEGEVFYFQERIGLYNQRFRIWKFATMLKNSPNMLTGSLTLRNDPRVTPVGKYLRMTKINEIPQVMNVLLGEMSLVGPRPQVQKDFLAYSPRVQSVINNVKPGITGIGSIVFRDEEKLLSVTPMNPHDFYQVHIAPYKGELELWYQANASMKTDLLILFLTAWQLFFPKSDFVFGIFRDLPQRPPELTVEGASKTRMKRRTEMAKA